MDDKREVRPDPYDLDEEEDFLHGLEEVYPWLRRRRRGSGAGGAGAGIIVLLPDPLTATNVTPPGTTIGTVSVVGGVGTYTFSLVDPTGRFTIVGNQVQTVSPLTAGFYNVTINATNGIGDNPSLPTVIYVTAVTSYAPTYPYYGF